MSAADPFGVYVHVPFCSRRCGYCDFNTYVAGPEAQQAYVSHALRELELAEQSLAGSVELPAGGVDTVFFGGGTPTLLPAADLARLLRGIDRQFGLRTGAEVSVEANPDTVDPGYLAELAAAGFNRVSFGMQSAVPQVLATLDRTHTPDRVATGVAAAHAAGLRTSVDLIYGTPGESLAAWERSIDAALALGVQHISAYALTLEPHVPLARAIAAGQVPGLDQDEQARKYELVDQRLSAAGLTWYEISNWAVPGQECAHNVGYWTGGQWLGIGPGAHSAIGRRRHWNVKRPLAYGQLVDQGRLPLEGGEELDDAAASLERVMLRIRTAAGIALSDVPPAGQVAAKQLAADGLVEIVDNRAVLTLRGRLLADLVTQALAG
ncbi:MAG: radical SAM family heme chaperone HemW [Bifidobacteriaceae bacterium]|nr:radical SAM family heme chaperone HemW [Bifidobacteriaceae bacterium]